MVRRLLIVLFFLTPMLVKGQQADRMAGNYMNQKSWFKLYDLYEKDSMQLSPVMRRMSEALILQAFNRPQEAIGSFKRLIREHRQTLDFNNINTFFSLMAKDYARMGQYQKASELLQDFARKIAGQVDQSIVNENRNLAALYQELAHYNLYETNGQQVYTLPFELKEIFNPEQRLIMMPGKINGTDCNFCFDTGASYNVISKEAASMLGAKVIGSGIKAIGTAQLNGKLVVIDSINIGNMLMRHVPFVVLDMMQNNALADTAMHALSYIIGQPFMMRFNSYTIDMQQHAITLSTEPIQSGHKPNLCLFSTLEVNVSKGADTFNINLDTGATTTQLGTSYYKDYNKEVIRDGKWDIVGGAGAGGVSYDSVFKLPQVNFSISGKSFQLHNIPVTSITSKTSVLSTRYGRLGIDFFLLWKKVRIDNVNMHIELQ